MKRENVILWGVWTIEIKHGGKARGSVALVIMLFNSITASEFGYDDRV